MTSQVLHSKSNSSVISFLGYKRHKSACDLLLLFLKYTFTQDYTMAHFTIVKPPCTHVLISLQTIKEFGWDRACVEGVIDYFNGNCNMEQIYDALEFIDKERINTLIEEMIEQNIITKTIKHA
jgi:hypothetical protein